MTKVSTSKKKTASWIVSILFIASFLVLAGDILYNGLFLPNLTSALAGNGNSSSNPADIFFWIALVVLVVTLPIPFISTNKKTTDLRLSLVAVLSATIYGLTLQGTSVILRNQAANQMMNGADLLTSSDFLSYWEDTFFKALFIPGFSFIVFTFFAIILTFIKTKQEDKEKSSSNN